jgi:hypothetical protein
VALAPLTLQAEHQSSLVLFWHSVRSTFCKPGTECVCEGGPEGGGA